jgi:hypothetical protein
MSAAGELAMTAADLARWDIAVMNRTVLKPSSYGELEREVLLASGAPTGYGLGVNVAVTGGRRQISHGGEVSGFTARNEIYPDEKVAIVVLVNIDANNASGEIARRIANRLFTESSDSRGAVDQARQIVAGLQRGEVDRALFTANMNAYFTPQALRDFADSLAPLGEPSSFSQSTQGLRGGMCAAPVRHHGRRPQSERHRVLHARREDRAVPDRARRLGCGCGLGRPDRNG